MRDEPIDTDTLTTPAGTFRVSYYRDEDPMSPREHDNLSVLVIDTPRSLDVDETRPDGRYPEPGDVRMALRAMNDGDVSTAGACRYLRLALDAWAVLPLYVHEDWAPSVSVVDADTRRGNGTIHGFAFDTPERRAVMGPESPEQAEQWLREDVEAFSRYTSGEYVGFVIERLNDPDGDADPEDDDATWTETEDGGSLWSIDSLSCAREEARALVESYRPEHFPSPVLAVQI